jgi:hypothetical protein
MGIAGGVPAICLNLFGGVFADTIDQRRLIITTQSLTAGLIFLLATLTLLDVVQVWHVLVIAFCAGRVIGFYGMTHNIMPLGGMVAGALANLITAPLAIAVGGLTVAAFALGPAMLNGEVRKLGARLRQIETVTTLGPPRQHSSPSTASS